MRIKNQVSKDCQLTFDRYCIICYSVPIFRVTCIPGTFAVCICTSHVSWSQGSPWKAFSTIVALCYMKAEKSQVFPIYSRPFSVKSECTLYTIHNVRLIFTV